MALDANTFLMIFAAAIMVMAVVVCVMLSDRRKDNGGLKRVRTRFTIPQVPDATVINVL